MVNVMLLLFHQTDGRGRRLAVFFCCFGRVFQECKSSSAQLQSVKLCKAVSCEYMRSIQSWRRRLRRLNCTDQTAFVLLVESDCIQRCGRDVMCIRQSKALSEAKLAQESVAEAHWHEKRKELLRKVKKATAKQQRFVICNFALDLEMHSLMSQSYQSQVSRVLVLKRWSRRFSYNWGFIFVLTKRLSIVHTKLASPIAFKAYISKKFRRSRCKCSAESQLLSQIQLEI